MEVFLGGCIILTCSSSSSSCRRSTDLDPLQYLLKKCIYVLETEGVPATLETSRPRVQLDQITVWLGMKAL